MPNNPEIRNNPEQEGPSHKSSRLRKLTAWALVSALAASPVKWGITVETGGHWTDTEEEREIEEDASRSQLERELERAKNDLEEAEDYSERREILQYIQMLEETIQDQSSPDRPDNHHTFEYKETAPQTIFVSLEGWWHSYTRASWKLLEPDTWSTKDEDASLSSRSAWTLQIKKWKAITKELQFLSNWRRTYKEVSFIYDGDTLKIRDEEARSRDYSAQSIPIVSRNRGDTIQVPLEDGYVIIEMERR